MNTLLFFILILLSVPLLLAVFLSVLIPWISAERAHRKTAYYEMTGRSYLSLVADKGAAGEYRAYRRLAYRETRGDLFLFNLYLPKSNGERAELDLLLLTRKGIFVIESKNYGGWIFGNGEDRYWTQTLRSREGVQRRRFYNPVLQNQGHIKALRELIGWEIPVFSVIVFSDRCQIKAVNAKALVATHSSLSYVLEEACLRLPDHFSDSEELRRLSALLSPYSRVSTQEKRAHAENVREKYAKEEDPSRCPRCNSPLTLRRVSRGIHTGQYFLGCSAYPRCRYTRNL